MNPWLSWAFTNLTVAGVVVTLVLAHFAREDRLEQDYPLTRKERR